jgi:hypothetical protein
VYWANAEVARHLFNTDGFALVRDARQWRDDYKGLNWTLATPDVFAFEVQVHTPASLAAAEATHDLYQRQRRLPKDSSAWRALAAQQVLTWRAVPNPPEGR